MHGGSESYQCGSEREAVLNKDHMVTGVYSVGE